MPPSSYCRYVIAAGQRCRNQVARAESYCYIHRPSVSDPVSISAFVANVLHESRLPDEHLSTVVAEFCEALPHVEREFVAERFMVMATNGPLSESPWEPDMNSLIERLNRTVEPQVAQDTTTSWPSNPFVGMQYTLATAEPPTGDLLDDSDDDDDSDGWEPPEPDYEVG